jgi:hypothetical protein
MLEKPKKNKSNHKAKTEALRISNETYNIVAERDNGCVLCNNLGMHKKTEEALKSGSPVLYECHHFISRAKLGMGIPENLVILCWYHHKEESQHREEIEKYLKNKHENWSKDKLIYNKTSNML